MKTECLCRPAWPQTPGWPWIQRSACLYLLSARIKRPAPPPSLSCCFFVCPVRHLRACWWVLHAVLPKLEIERWRLDNSLSAFFFLPFFFLFLNYILLVFCMYVCVSMSDPLELQLQTVDRCELPCGCWELNPGPLKNNQCSYLLSHLSNPWTIVF